MKNWNRENGDRTREGRGEGRGTGDGDGGGESGARLFAWAIVRERLVLEDLAGLTEVMMGEGGGVGEELLSAGGEGERVGGSCGEVEQSSRLKLYTLPWKVVGEESCCSSASCSASNCELDTFTMLASQLSSSLLSSEIRNSSLAFLLVLSLLLLPPLPLAHPR